MKPKTATADDIMHVPNNLAKTTLGNVEIFFWLPLQLGISHGWFTNKSSRKQNMSLIYSVLLGLLLKAVRLKKIISW